MFPYDFDKNINLVTSYLDISTKMCLKLEVYVSIVGSRMLKTTRAQSTLEIKRYANSR